MELRQLRYFVRVVELGSMGRAASELGVVTSALSQQIGRLEGELSTRLLQRSRTGTVPTEAGLAFMRQAQLTLRHAAAAVQAAQQARLTGQASVGMAPSTAASLGLPFLQAMRERYPEVRLHLVEALSGHLAAMLDARQLDLAVVFDAGPAARRWQVTPLLGERLFLIGRSDLAGMPGGARTTLKVAARLPLVLPTGTHGLRSLVDGAFASAGHAPRVALEIDGLALLMDVVRAGVAATLQPGAALGRGVGPDPQVAPPTRKAAVLRCIELVDPDLRRPSLLVSIPEDELPPAGLAARVVLLDTARRLVADGRWTGATLHES